MLLENLVPKERIEEMFKKHKEAEEEFIKNYSKEYPTRNAEEDFKISSKLNEILKNKVLNRLITEAKELTDQDVNEDDLLQIVNFALIMGDPSKILNYDFCAQCGKCCKEASPISITYEEYMSMTRIEPDFVTDIEPDFDYGGFKFIVDNPCKFLDEKSNKCKIYDLRPHSCRRYPVVNSKGFVGDGECEYVVTYMFEKSRAILIECLNR